MLTTLDAFLGGQIWIEQVKQGSRAGIYAVFLAAACPVEAGERVLELGSGSGIVSLAIARRVEGAGVTGVEIDPELCRLAACNAGRNGLEDRAAFICGDVTGAASRLFAEGLAPDSYDHAVANPPFLVSGQARLPQDARLRRAHTHETGDLERWVKCMATFVKPGGSITIIHRTDVLPQLFDACSGRFGALTVYPLYPRPNSAANRIILQGRKGSRGPLKLLQGMALHESDRDFTAEADEILRGGQGLKFS